MQKLFKYGIMTYIFEFLSCIALYCAKLVLHLIANGEGETRTGVLVPMPRPHTLPMLLDEAGMTVVPYQLKESQGWALHLEELHQALKTARRHCKPIAIYISNPGNPTGKPHKVLINSSPHYNLRYNYLS